MTTSATGRKRRRRRRRRNPNDDDGGRHCHSRPRPGRRRRRRGPGGETPALRLCAVACVISAFFSMMIATTTKSATAAVAAITTTRRRALSALAFSFEATTTSFSANSPSNPPPRRRRPLLPSSSSLRRRPSTSPLSVVSRAAHAVATEGDDDDERHRRFHGRFIPPRVSFSSSSSVSSFWSLAASTTFDAVEGDRAAAADDIDDNNNQEEDGCNGEEHDYDDDDDHEELDDLLQNVRYELKGSLLRTKAERKLRDDFVEDAQRRRRQQQQRSSWSALLAQRWSVQRRAASSTTADTEAASGIGAATAKEDETETEITAGDSDVVDKGPLPPTTTRGRNDATVAEGAVGKMSPVTTTTTTTTTTETETDDEYEYVDDDWWNRPGLNESYDLPTISVPARHVHRLMAERHRRGGGSGGRDVKDLTSLKQYLAINLEGLSDIHPKIKMVRDVEVNGNGGGDVTNNMEKDAFGSEKRKLILLHPDTAAETTAARIGIDRGSEGGNDLDVTPLRTAFPGLPGAVLRTLLETYDARPGPTFTVEVPHGSQPLQRVLTKLLPDVAHPPPSAFEQIGHVIHLNLKQRHHPYRKLIGSVLLDRLRHAGTRTVVNKVGEVGGPYRTYDMEVLAGVDNTNVTVVESGASLAFDVRRVYWCTRLSGERTRMIERDFRQGDVVADAFCGAGALCVRAALEKHCRIVANDLNPDAVEFCRANARNSGVPRSTFHVQCGDARKFIRELGMAKGRGAAGRQPMLPNHLVMNYPAGAADFLDSLRWWETGRKRMEVEPWVHVYTFARGDNDDGCGRNGGRRPRTPAEVAVDMVAQGLLPEGGYIEVTRFRGKELNRLGCQVRAREIRDVAPGKVVICVSFRATRLLLRHMQGDFAFA